EEQERMRREFVSNAAHELRTPLTNLQGYLEALRDGVMTADRATFESLHEEVDRMVRLSRSIDALAEGDGAARGPGELGELELRSGHPRRGPTARVRALLPRREIARPGERRRGDRPRDRQDARRARRRSCRCRVGARPDALLVQPSLRDLGVKPRARP